MQYTDQYIDHIIKQRCLPPEFRQDVIDIISMEDYDASLEELNVMTAQCYRFEPNHSRYDARRDLYPRVAEDVEVVT